MQNPIVESCNKLIGYIEDEKYRGYDPYDALTSSLFKLPVLKSNKIIRFGFQQLVKRSPIDLRSFLFIKKGYNPVTLGLCIQGYTNLGEAGIMEQSLVLEKCNFLISELEKMISKGYHGACWGYDFPWESRSAQIPAFAPTIVATGFITNALFQFYKYSKNQKAIELCASACNFILNDIKRTILPDGTFCFSYSPNDNYQVLNASMKGVRTLSQVYSVTNESKLISEAQNAIRFVVKNQATDGSWKYAAGKTAEWIDNYHTGYVLDCLDEYIKHSGDEEWKAALLKGFDYYRENFFEDGYKPKFYNNSRYPLDCTSAGQSILTLCRFGDLEKAEKVANFTIEEMQDPKGYFYFRKYRYFTEKQSFMRWSNSWMFAGLTELIKTRLKS